MLQQPTKWTSKICVCDQIHKCNCDCCAFMRLHRNAFSGFMLSAEHTNLSNSYLLLLHCHHFVSILWDPVILMPICREPLNRKVGTIVETSNAELEADELTSWFAGFFSQVKRSIKPRLWAILWCLHGIIAIFLTAMRQPGENECPHFGAKYPTSSDEITFDINCSQSCMRVVKHSLATEGVSSLKGDIPTNSANQFSQLLKWVEHPLKARTAMQGIDSTSFKHNYLAHGLKPQ